MKKQMPEVETNTDADFEAFLAETEVDNSATAQYESDLMNTQAENAKAAMFENDGFDAFMQERPEEETLNDVDDDQLSAWFDVPLQAVGGIRDAGQSLLDFGEYLNDKMDLPVLQITDAQGNFDLEILSNKESKERGIKGIQLPEVDEAETTAGAITRPVAQFLAPFSIVSKGTKAIGVADKIGKATPFVNGAIADFLAFESHEARLSNVINDVGWGNVITEYLAADEDDGEVEGRLKNTIEGAGLGGLADGLFRAIKFMKDGKTARTVVKTAKETVVKRTQEMKKATKQAMDNRKIAEIRDETITFKKSELPPRPAKETISIPVQEKMADALGTTLDEVQKGDVFQKIRKLGVQDELNKVTNLQETQFNSLKEALPDYMKRLEIGDKTAADDFIANELRAFLETDGAAKDAFQDVARVLGRRGKSEAVQSANELSKFLSRANELTKDQVVKAFAGIVEKTGDVNVLVKNLSKATRLEKANKVIGGYYINALLSSPKTLLVDTWSNPVWTSVLAAERIPAAVIGKMRRGLFHGERAKDAVQFQEAKIMMDSYVNTISDGFKYMGKAYGKIRSRSDSTVEALRDTTSLAGRKFKDFRIDTQTRFDTPRAERAIKAENFGVETNTTLGKFIDITGSVVNAPTTYMQAKDDVAKALLYRGEVQTLAHRRAVMEGLTGADYAKRIKELTDVPLNDVGLDAQNLSNNRLVQLNKALAGDDAELVSAAISRSSREFAQRGTFTQELGPIAKAAQTFFNELPGGRIIVPFIKTLTNLIKVFAERTPLAPFSKSIRADIAAGGARADLALGRIAMGTGLMTWAYSMAMNGKLTGEGPRNKAERDALLKTGWRPRSLKMGDKYVEIGRMDPLASFLQFPANLVDLNDQLHNDLTGDLEKDVSDYVALNILAASNMFSSKSFTANVGELMDTVSSEDENKMQRLINFYGSSFVPNAITFVGNEVDPTMKEASTLWEAIQKKAGLGEVPKRNVFGEVVTRDPQTIGYMIPMSYATVDRDPTLQKLVAGGAYLRMPEKRIEGVELDIRQYDRLMVIMQEMDIKGAIDNLTESPLWEGLPDVSETGIEGAQSFTKAGMASRLYSEFIKVARQQLISEDESLKLRIDEHNAKLRSAPKASPLTQRVLQGQGISIENSGNPVTFNPSGE
jgi:hypothetical protein